MGMTGMAASVVLAQEGPQQPITTRHLVDLLIVVGCAGAGSWCESSLHVAGRAICLPSGDGATAVRDGGQQLRRMRQARRVSWSNPGRSLRQDRMRPPSHDHRRSPSVGISYPAAPGVARRWVPSPRHQSPQWVGRWHRRRDSHAGIRLFFPHN